ncbi:MAG: TaqI family restriction endonuclease [Candidatus Moranbacteria bacterium]|nr:TaqI family restriction endonuclease [Candidatus Moranbacteria bacterium]
MYLQKFSDFLKTVNLSAYREKYSSIKIVEMNLPKNIQAIKLLYRIYWDEKNFVDFNAFYDIYRRENRKKLSEFRKKIGMCPSCFKKGIEARIYRTWAGLITQMHAGYVAESVFGKNTVNMSEELDHKGADIQVQYRELVINYDVKKKSNSGVMGRSHKPKEPIPGITIPIRYEVPDLKTILHPKKKRGTGFLKSYLTFKKNYLDTKMLRVFSNGFVIFEPYIFEQKKEEIDSKLK